MCPNCRAFVPAADKVCPYCDASLGERPSQRESASSDTVAGFIPNAGFTTFVILLINLGLYIATVIVSMKLGGEGNFLEVSNQALVGFGAKYAPFIAAGQWWRLITAGFLHGGLIHIFMNSWVLLSVGAEVEETYGTARFLVLYFVSTVAGFYASTMFSPASISVGASAALFGLIGAMIAAGMRSGTALGHALKTQYTQWVVYMLVIGLLPIFNVDMAAHIGGLVAGFAISWLMDTPRAMVRWTDMSWGIIAAVCVALTAASFALMLRQLFA